jgi:hypothetical protein
MEEFNEEESNKIELSRNLKRRYAKALQTFELGLYGVEPERIKCVTLTTWSDAMMKRKGEKDISRNNWKQIVKDNNFLKIAMAKDGFPYRYCFCGEISPKNKLIHLHGFMVFEKSYDYALIHEKLSKHWKRIHDSEIVWVKDMWDTRGAIAYDCKHAVKNHVGETFIYSDSGRMLRMILKSRDWFPPGCMEMLKTLRRWTSEKVDFIPEDEDEVTEEYWGREYMPFKWEMMKDYLRRWCEGEELLLYMKDWVLLIQGDKIIKMEIEQLNENER